MRCGLIVLSPYGFPLHQMHETGNYKCKQQVHRIIEGAKDPAKP